MTSLRLGTRKSALAQVQARWVSDQLIKANAGLSIELVLITTSGDLASQEGSKSAVPENAPVHGLQGTSSGQGGLKALFTKELEDALLQKRIDLAVHSLKDMAGEIPAGLVLACVPLREDPRDVWISKRGVPFSELRQGAVVATGAVRRQAQLLHARPDLELVDLRGNVDTRLSKMAHGEFEGMILALAGLKRLGREKEATEILSIEAMLPAVGQGALAIETRAEDAAVQKLVKTIDDAPSHQAVLAERGFLKALGGNCRTPLAAYARVTSGQVSLSGLVVHPSGNPFLHATAEGPAQEAEHIGERLAKTLLARGADKILR